MNCLGYKHQVFSAKVNLMYHSSISRIKYYIQVFEFFHKIFGGDFLLGRIFNWGPSLGMESDGGGALLFIKHSGIGHLKN